MALQNIKLRGTDILLRYKHIKVFIKYNRTVRGGKKKTVKVLQQAKKVNAELHQNNLQKKTVISQNMKMNLVIPTGPYDS